MAELAVVRRYARALFDTAQQMDAVPQVEADLKGLDDVLRASPTLMRALRAPTISTVRKKELVRQAFGERASALTLRFLLLVVDRSRYSVLTHIHDEFRRLADEARNLLPVEVSAATPLTDGERDRLTAALSHRTGKTIELRVSIDPALMGGLVVRMGDTVIDGSVRSKLEQLRDRLLAGRIV